MAAKKSKTPAVRYLRYELTNSGDPGTETSHFIDLAKDLSAINRRLYRQGRSYHVKRVSVVSSNTIAGFGVGELIPGTGIDQEIVRNAGRVTFSCVPESWMTQQAWKRGFQTWQKMQRKAMKNAGSDIRGTWNDFKVYMSLDHRSGTVLVPKDNGGNNLQFGEWTYSKFISPDGTTSSDELDIHMMGAHSGSAGSWNSAGLVKSYAESRATVQADQPDTSTLNLDDPLMNLFDDGTVTDEVLQDIRDEGDTPPYEANNYAGGAGNLPKPLVVQQSTLGADGRTSVGGFTAMCGLIEIETTSPIASDVYSVLVELAPGSYRGIAAEVI
jgi:hypothetical protein